MKRNAATKIDDDVYIIEVCSGEATSAHLCRDTKEMETIIYASCDICHVLYIGVMLRRANLLYSFFYMHKKPFGNRIRTAFIVRVKLLWKSRIRQNNREGTARK